MKLALTIIYIVIALLLTAIVLFQKGKDQSTGAVMGTSSDSFFSKNKANTREGMLEKLTSVLAVVFFVLSILLSLNVVK